jgi:uncharacterized membrane protein YhaH (DUF805 family)
MAQPSLARVFVDGLFGLEGRMPRSDFWVATIALSMAAALLGVGLTSGLRLFFPDMPIWVIPLALQLFIVWPLFAISVKRGHDRERSAVWTLWVNVAFHVVPFVLVAIGQYQGAFWVYGVIGVYILVDYGVLDGTEGPNKYGPSPKGSIRV